MLVKKVIQGHKRGRHIGFPTANFSPENVDISHGVYVCSTSFLNNTYFGVMHFGPKKSFEGDVSLEIHILEFSGNIYDKEVCIDVLQKIRDIQSFNSVNDLVCQIKKDIITAKEIIHNIKTQ